MLVSNRPSDSRAYPAAVPILYVLRSVIGIIGKNRWKNPHAVEACDSVHTDFSYTFLRAVSADEVARLDLADDLEVGALGECSRIFGGLAKHHAAMPGGSRHSGRAAPDAGP